MNVLIKIPIILKKLQVFQIKNVEETNEIR